MYLFFSADAGLFRYSPNGYSPHSLIRIKPFCDSPYIDVLVSGYWINPEEGSPSMEVIKVLSIHHHLMGYSEVHH